MVVLDGLGAHRTQKVRECVDSTGAQLLFFLASYSSPDSNPIEEAFSKTKSIVVRKAGDVPARR